MSKNLKKLLILNIPYLVLGLLFTKLPEAWRYTNGADIGEKILSLGGGFSKAFAVPFPSFYPTDLLIGLVIGGLLRLVIYFKGKNAKKYRKGVEYGSARWGNAKDIEPYVAPVFQDNVILTQTERLTMNSRPKDPKTARNKNVLIVGGSGSGKTRFWLKPNLLTGLMYCADCGGKMYVHRINNGKRVAHYTCAEYSKVPVGVRCNTQHRIKADAVLALIADMLKAIAEYSKNDRIEFIKAVQDAQTTQQTADINKRKKRLVIAQKRASELEKLICKIYEDNALGKLPDSRYAALDAQYAKEQDELSSEIADIETAISGFEESKKSAEKFIALVNKYEGFDTLTNTMLNEFVEKILVHERDRKGSQDTTQEVEIYFTFVGRYIPPHFGEVSLTAEEQEELRKKEERKDRLHENYLRRKENGKYREYEERTKAAKKAEMDAKKATIRAEDMTRGLYISVGNLPLREPQIAINQPPNATL